jgi:hypothetical protein
MNVKRIFHTQEGRVLLSIILGIGLATMFRHVCEGKNCIAFNGPVISEMDGQIYKFNEVCYKMQTKAVKCDAKKKTVAIKDKNIEEMYN